MTVPILAPCDVDEYALSTWFYGDGATVDAGEVVAELMVEKSTYEITAPASGCLRILVEADGTVGPGAVLGHIAPQAGEICV